MRGLKVFLLILIALLVLMNGWIYLTSMNLERTILNSAYYQSLIHETDLTGTLYRELEESLPDILLEQIEGEIIEAKTDEEEKLITASINIMITFFKQSFDEAWFEEQLILVIDDFLALFKGEQKHLSAVIDLSEGKESFIKAVSAFVEKGTTAYRDNLVLTPEYIDSLFNSMDIPDQLVMSELIGDHINPTGLEKVVSTQRLAWWAYNYLSYAAFALFLLLSCFLAGFGGGLKWFGATSLFSGLTYLISLQLVKLIISPVLMSALSNDFTFLPNLINMIIENTINVISTGPIIYAAIGLAFIIIGTISSKIRFQYELSPHDQDQ